MCNYSCFKYKHKFGNLKINHCKEGIIIVEYSKYNYEFINLYDSKQLIDEKYFN